MNKKAFICFVGISISNPTNYEDPFADSFEDPFDSDDGFSSSTMFCGSRKARAMYLESVRRIHTKKSEGDFCYSLRVTASGDDLVLGVVEFNRCVGEVFADCEAKKETKNGFVRYLIPVLVVFGLSELTLVAYNLL